MKDFFFAAAILVMAGAPNAMGAIKIKTERKANVPSAHFIYIDNVDEDTTPDGVASLISEYLAKHSGHDVTNIRVVKSTLGDSLKLLEKPQANYSPLAAKEIRKIYKYGEKYKVTTFIVHLRSLSMNGGGLTLYHVFVNRNNLEALSVEQFLYNE